MATPSYRSSLPKVSRRRSLRIFAATAIGSGAMGPSLTFAQYHRLRRRYRSRLPREADLALDWFDLILKLIKMTPGYTPPVASRSLGYISCALYAAAHGGMPGFRSLDQVLGSLPALRKARNPLHYGVAANAALAEATAMFFPTTNDALWEAIDQLKAQYDRRYRSEAGSTFTDSERHGRIIAQQIYAHSTSDGADAAYDNNFPRSYVPPAGFGLWEPTDASGSLQPYWGNNRALAMARNDMFDPGLHQPAFSNQVGSPFYNLANQVRLAVNDASPEQIAIAKFWSDDPKISVTPPGHSFSIATQVLRAQGRSLQKSIEVYVKLGISQADAFISCWESKYRHNVIRPITYIRRYFPGEQNWSPLIPTPPFPEYTSGHSVQSGAMAEVLGELLGRNYAFVDRTHEERGLGSRDFASFEDAAQEAAISRLYGGVHYTPAIELGVAQGRKVGKMVNRLPFKRCRRW